MTTPLIPRADLYWLIQSRERYESINRKRDGGGAVSSCDKEFVHAFERKERTAIKAAEAKP